MGLEPDYSEIETEREKFGWMRGLLVSTGDQFAEDAALALEFLGFQVERVDDGLAPRERRREDMRIREPDSDFFALGEAKTTGKGRGASEDAITKTQTHQGRYSKEEKVPVPPALLVINFAIDFDPRQRSGRFYQLEVAGRLEDASITAINSVALYDICQAVVEGRMSTEQARAFLKKGQPMINTFELENAEARAIEEPS